MRNDMFVDGQNVHTRSKWKTNDKNTYSLVYHLLTQLMLL